MPKILWMSPYTLLDKSSGASVNALQMLQYLQHCGYEIWSCSAFCCDNPSGAQEMFSKLKIEPKNNKQPVLSLNQDGIRYIFTSCRSTQEYDMTIEECQLFFNIYLKVLDEFKPDFVIGYGLSPLPILCRFEAKLRGIAVIQLVVNGEQKGFNFPCIDLALTESFATADYYAEKSLLNLKSTGIFCDKEAYLAPVRRPQFVTMINPSPNKGAAILAKLMSVCETRMPEVKFLVIETRAKFSQVQELLHSKDNEHDFPLKGHHFTNLQILPLQSHMQNVYAVTAVLLVPSLWFESWGRVNTEAAFNHIPVLSTTSGGIREAFGGAGISLDAPEHCQNDYLSLPTDDEIEPWIEALQQLLHKNWDEQFVSASKLHSMKTSYLRLSNLLHQLRPELVQANDLKIPFDYKRLNRLYAPQALSFESSLKTSVSQVLDLNEDNSTRSVEFENKREPMLEASSLSLQTPSLNPRPQSTELELTPCFDSSHLADSSSSNEHNIQDVISAGWTLSPEVLMPSQPEHFDQKFMAALDSEGIAMPLVQDSTSHKDNREHKITSSQAVEQIESNTCSIDTTPKRDDTLWAKHCNELNFSDLLCGFQSVK